MDKATPPDTTRIGAERPSPAHGMVSSPGCALRASSDAQCPEDALAHRVSVGDFWINTALVTDMQFGSSAEEGRHVSFAEIPPDRQRPQRHTCDLSLPNGPTGPGVSVEHQEEG